MATNAHLSTWLVLVLSHTAGAASICSSHHVLLSINQLLCCMLHIFTIAALVLMCSFVSGLLQVVKLSPQPHEPFEFGLLNVNSDLHISTSCELQHYACAAKDAQAIGRHYKLHWVSAYLMRSSTKSILVPNRCISAGESISTCTPFCSTSSSNFPFSSAAAQDFEKLCL